MAGQRTFHVLIISAFGLLLTPHTRAQTPQPTVSQQSFTQIQPGKRGGGAIDSERAPEFENARKAIEALSPEQRKRFQENFMRWMNLSPEEKKTLREREEWRKEIMAQEVEHALKQSGLTLDPVHRELYAKRYAEERRAIEMQLRKEVEEKRRPLVQALISRLKQEFSGPLPVASTPAPGAVTPLPQ